MIKTEYICDRCGAVQTTVQQFWKVAVTVSALESPAFGSSGMKFGQWCRACVERIGLLPKVQTKDESPTLPPTLEEMIREIIREEVEAAR